MSPATTALAALAVLVFIGLGLEVLQRRTGIPDALVLLFLGVLARQLGWLDVETLGGLVPIFTTSALVLLLFESAIDMRLADLRGAAANTLRLTVVSYVFSAIVVAGVAILVLQLPLLHALLLGSILGGTSTSGPAGLREADRGFVQETAFLMKLLFFVYLGASFRVTDLGGLLMGALAAAAILLLARPLATRLSLSVKRASRRDAMVCAVIAPKGLAAAVLATLPAQRGLPGGERIATVVAAGVVVSIVASSLLSVFAARPRGLLGLRQVFSRYPEAIDGKAAVESPEEEPSAV